MLTNKEADRQSKLPTTHGDGKPTDSLKSEPTMVKYSTSKETESDSEEDQEMPTSNSSLMPRPRLSSQRPTEVSHLPLKKLERTDTDLSLERPKEPHQNSSPDQEEQVLSNLLPTRTLFGRLTETVSPSLEETETETGEDQEPTSKPLTEEIDELLRY